MNRNTKCFMNHGRHYKVRYAYMGCWEITMLVNGQWVWCGYYNTQRECIERIKDHPPITPPQ
jgi:hypothetical protein